MDKDDGYTHGKGHAGGAQFEVRYRPGEWWFRMKGCRLKKSWHGPYSCRSAAERAAGHLAQSGFAAGLQPGYR